MTADKSEFVEADQLVCGLCDRLTMNVEFDADHTTAYCEACDHRWSVEFKPVSLNPDLARLEALVALNRVVDAVTNAREALEALQELCADRATTDELDHRGIKAFKAYDELEMRALSWTRRLRNHWAAGYSPESL